MSLPPEEVPVPLYSQRAINITTFFGGPLAAAILMRRNFINLGRETAGLYTIITGVLGTFIVIAIILLTPEHIIEKVPNFVIPAIYTTIIALIVEKIHGPILREHKAAGKPFYSAWYAAGIGLFSSTILVGTILAYVFLQPGFDSDYYDQQMTTFIENESKALELYDMVEIEPIRKVLNFIKDKGIPAWEKNIAILDGLDSMQNMPADLHMRNGLLRNYCLMRIEVFELIYKAVKENTNMYDEAIRIKNEEIEKIIEELS